GRGRGARRLRHVQGGRSRDDHHRPAAAAQGGRPLRHLHGPRLMLAVDEATARVLAPLSALPCEIVPLAAGLGRVLARDLVATRDQPPCDLSAMDGYAVRAADLAAGEAWLEVVGDAPAGGAYERPLRPGEAVRIF